MFLITSVIVPSKNPLDYTSVRSVFTPEERLNQTIESIRSVRKYTNQKILLVECSNHVTEKFDISKLKDLVDVFVDLSDDIDMLSVCNSPNKSWAEIQMIDRVIDYMAEGERIYKLSGRYFLLDTFDIKKLDYGQISAKLFIDNLPTRCCGVVYSIQDRETCRDFTSHCIQKYKNRKHVSMEDMLYAWATTKKFNVVDSVNAGGLIAVSGNKETY